MAAFAWPLSICGMIVIILIILTRRFPTQIGSLIDRITSIGATGLRAKPATPVVNQEVKDITKTEAAEEQLRAFDNQLLVWHENNFRNTLLKAVVDPADRERILVRHLAALFLTLSFESIYNGIWGSQISALQAVNESGAAGTDPTTLQVWYEFGKTMSPARYAEYPFENWLGYLHGSYLVETGIDGHICITNFGNEFLLYMVRSKYTFHKDG
jgi:hypothetical protein